MTLHLLTKPAFIYQRMYVSDMVLGARQPAASQIEQKHLSSFTFWWEEVLNKDTNKYVILERKSAVNQN